MATITWQVLADFARSGSYTDDLTGYVENPGSGIRISRGRGSDGMFRISQVTLVLSNRSGAFTPDNSASAFYGKLRPGVPIKITATHSSIAYTLWTGYAREFKCSWAAGEVPVCTIAARDLADWLPESDPVNVAVSTSRDTDGALTEIATALGLVAGDLNFDDGQQDLPWHYVQAQPAMQAMADVVRSEMGGLLWVAADGRLRFESRASRIGITADDTWGDGTDIVPKAVDYLFDPQDYITSVRVRSTVYQEGDDDIEMLRFVRSGATADAIAIGVGEVWTRDLDLAGVASAIVVPQANVDYLGNSAQDGSGTDKTSTVTVLTTDLGGGRVQIRVTHSDASTVYLTFFRLRATPLLFSADRPEVYLQKAVSGEKVVAGVNIDIPFGNDANQITRDYAVQILRTYRYPYPAIVLTFDAGGSSAAADSAKKVALLSAELGDLIDLTLASMQLNASTTAAISVDDWFYIEALEYEIPPDLGGTSFTCRVTLVPSYIYRDLSKIVYDDIARNNATGSMGTALKGGAWAGNTSSFDIVSKAFRPNTNAASVAVLDLGAGATDQVVEVSLGNLSADTDEKAGVVFRYADASNHYRAYWDDSTDTIRVDKVVGGVVTNLQSVAP